MTFLEFTFDGRPVYVRSDSIIGFEKGNVWLTDGNTIVVAEDVEQIKALLDSV